MVKRVDEPTYTRFITESLSRFDARDTVYSRGFALETDVPSTRDILVHVIEKAKKGILGYLIEDYALQIAARTIDELCRRTMLGTD